MKAKVLKIITLMSIIVLSILSFVGCAINCGLPKYEDKEVGDFIVRFYENKDYCEIKGTTEQGNDKRFLVIPEYIEGVRVESLGVYNGFSMEANMLSSPEIKSDKIEKVYFERAIKVSDTSFHETASNYDCPNLKKVMYPGRQVTPYKMIRFGLVYIPRNMCENVELANASWRSTIPANVSYHYNYESAPNDGYYWIDDYDYCGKIEFIPKDPVREGNTFGGWYNEPECINKWDFDADTLPEEITKLKEYAGGEFEEVPVYQETILYAKWV